MLTVDEAFLKFKGRLEITDTELSDASSRQTTIRRQIQAWIDVQDTFLSGSYVRHTKTKPLKDVDIFVVLGAKAQSWRGRPPVELLQEFKRFLSSEYGDTRVSIARRSVRVDFGVAIVDDVSGQVLSIDVVPAFDEDDHFVIPDKITGRWMASDPRIHADLATAANSAFDDRWKPIVKMLKKWNDNNAKPIKPSFLIEVMALQLLTGPWTHSYPREIKGFFGSATDSIGTGWADPAGLGDPVSDRLDGDPSLMTIAKQALWLAERSCSEAINDADAGRVGSALSTWQTLFGPLFAKS